MAGQHNIRRRGGGHAVLLAAAACCIFQFAVEFAPHPPAALVLQAAADVSNTAEVIDVDFDGADIVANKSSIGQIVAERSHAAAAVVLLLALVVAKMEGAVPQPGPVALEKRSDYSGVLFMNALLSLTAGMLNALAFLEMAATIAHHSGNLTHWGRNWGIDSFRFACYLAALMFGGVVVVYVKSDYEGIFLGRFSPSMLCSVVAVTGGTMIKMMGGEALPTLVLWAFALGVQNGLCRKFSSMPLCSTHFTGYLTDAGNFLGVWVRSKVFGESSPNMMKFTLFMACMVSFAVGGFAAKLGRDAYGMVVAFVPAVLMAGVAFGVFPMSSSAHEKK